MKKIKRIQYKGDGTIKGKIQIVSVEIDKNELKYGNEIILEKKSYNINGEISNYYRKSDCSYYLVSGCKDDGSDVDKNNKEINPNGSSVFIEKEIEFDYWKKIRGLNEEDYLNMKTKECFIVIEKKYLY